MTAPWTPEQLARLFALQASDALFELLIEELYQGLLRPGDHAVDGGANAGRHTLPMSRCVGAAGRIHAYEPFPELADQLAVAVAPLGNVVVHQVALGAQEGHATFYALPDQPALSSLADRPLTGSPRTVQVDVAVELLDRLADEPIRFIKLDLEGGELHALQGGRRLLVGQSPVIAFECGRIGAARHYGYTADAFFALFAEVGYGLITIFGQPFVRDDFARGWDDRVIPHYLVAAPLARIPALTDRMMALTGDALHRPDWRWDLDRGIVGIRPRVAALPGARPVWRGMRSVAERIRR